MMIPPSNDPRQERNAAVILRMAELVARERTGELNELDREELDRWLTEKPEHSIWKDKLSDPAYVSAMQETYAIAERGMESSLEAFHRSHIDDTPIHILGQKPTRRWWWAAAVLAPLLVAGIWWIRNNNTPPAMAKAPAVDIRPGRYTATLTLANGQQVSLDTGRSGRLYQSGSVQVDFKDGQVAYHGAGASANIMQYNTLSTAKGGIYRLVLPDSTKVWLNAMSSIRYPTSFFGRERHVELTGEAYFEVAAGKDQPFTVGVSGASITVLGTAFDVMAYPEEGKKKMTLIDGAIKVGNGNDARQLRPGQQAIMEEAGPVTVTSDVNIDNVIAWKLGFFQFSHMNIKTLMREIARWYDVDVIYQRTDLSGEYGGRISRNLNLSDLIGLLEGNGFGNFKVEGRRLIVLP